MGFKAISVVDVIGNVVAEVKKTIPDVFYYHSRVPELSSALASMMKGNNIVFPLVYLVENITEKPNPDAKVAAVSLTMYIATTSKQDIRSSQRHETVIKPKLYPIYEALMDALEKSKEISYDYKAWPIHDKTDIPFVSGDEMLANKCLDAIKIENLELKIKINAC